MYIFFINFGDFLNNPLYFGFNSENRKTYFCVFLVSGTFWTSKESNIFSMSIFQGNEDCEKKKSTRRDTRQGRGGTTRSPPLAAWWASFPLMGPFLNFFASKSS
jgi:hypothetical protein